MFFLCDTYHRQVHTAKLLARERAQESKQRRDSMADCYGSFAVVQQQQLSLYGR